MRVQEMRKLSYQQGAILLFMALWVGLSYAQPPNKDSFWWSSPPKPEIFFDKKISSNQILEVTESLQPQTQKLLSNTSHVEIRNGDISKYSSRRFPLKDTNIRRYYLVRAVRLPTGGYFTGYINGSAVYIVHGDLGHIVGMRRTAVLIAVDRKINKVYSTSSSVE